SPDSHDESRVLPEPSPGMRPGLLGFADNSATPLPPASTSTVTLHGSTAFHAVIVKYAYAWTAPCLPVGSLAIRHTRNAMHAIPTSIRLIAKTSPAKHYTLLD